MARISIAEDSNLPKQREQLSQKNQKSRPPLVQIDINAALQAKRNPKQTGKSTGMEYNSELIINDLPQEHTQGQDRLDSHYTRTSQHYFDLNMLSSFLSYIDFLDLNSKYLIAALLLVCLWSAVNPPNNRAVLNVPNDERLDLHSSLEDATDSTVPTKTVEVDLPLGYLRQVPHTGPSVAKKAEKQSKPSQHSDIPISSEIMSDVSLHMAYESNNNVGQNSDASISAASDDLDSLEAPVKLQAFVEETLEISEEEVKSAVESDDEHLKNFPWEAAVISGPIRLSLNVKEVSFKIALVITVDK